MTQGLQPARVLCPWNSPGKNTGVDCHALLQGIFPTQGLNLALLHCRRILYHLRGRFHGQDAKTTGNKGKRRQRRTAAELKTFAKQKQARRRKRMDTKGIDGGGRSWGTGVDTHLLLTLCIEEVTNESPLHSTGSSTQRSVRPEREGRPQKRGHAYMDG